MFNPATYQFFKLAVYPVGRSTDRSLFMEIMVYNYKELSWIATKFGVYILPLADLHACQISAQSKYVFQS